jgi:hypothetical protein
MKETIRRFKLDLGVDDVGFVSARDYGSPQSPPLDSIFPGARSLVVLACGELDSCDSPDSHIAMNSRMDLMEFSRSCNYKVSRRLQRTFGARAMTVPVSYPMEMKEETKGAEGQVSLHHGVSLPAAPERRATDPNRTFRRHLRSIGVAIEEEHS